MAFARVVIRERVAFVNEGLRLNIVFSLPGPMIQPDYEGVHAQRLRRQDGHLLVVAAVPGELKADQVPAYAAGVLKAALQEARQWMAKRRILYDLTSLQALIDDLVETLQADGFVAEAARRTLESVE